MRDFFKFVLKIGLQIFLLLALIWLVFFGINYFYPQAFSFFNRAESGEKIPFRYKVYNLFFKGSPKTKVATNTQDKEFYEQNGTVWGYGTSTIRNKNKLKIEDNYIYLNSEDNEVANNFKVDDELVNGESTITIYNNSVIIGDISLGYLATPYFYVDFYNSAGDYLYSVLGHGLIDSRNNIMRISFAQNQNYNSTHYTGSGFIVIWPDNDAVESVVILKIEILDQFKEESLSKE